MVGRCLRLTGQMGQTAWAQMVWALQHCQCEGVHGRWDFVTLMCRLVVVGTLSQNVGRPHTATNSSKLSLRLKLFGVEVWSWFSGVKAIWIM